MASELKVDKFTGVTTAGSILVTGEGNSTTTNLQQGLAKSWVHFDGTGTISTRESLNVSSLTDSSSGQYYVNYNNNMGTGDYAVLACDRGNDQHISSNEPANSASQVRLFSVDWTSTTFEDSSMVMGAVLGDLA